MRSRLERSLQKDCRHESPAADVLRLLVPETSGHSMYGAVASGNVVDSGFGRGIKIVARHELESMHD